MGKKICRDGHEWEPSEFSWACGIPHVQRNCSRCSMVQRDFYADRDHAHDAKTVLASRPFEMYDLCDYWVRWTRRTPIPVDGLTA